MSVRWQKMALLVFWALACVSEKTKCAICAVALKFKIFCAVGKKLKHRRVGNECRLTRCPIVVSFLCLCSPVKMVYSLFKFWLFVRYLHGRFTIGYNSFIPATSLPQYTPSGRIGATGLHTISQ